MIFFGIWDSSSIFNTKSFSSSVVFVLDGELDREPDFDLVEPRSPTKITRRNPGALPEIFEHRLNHFPIR